MGYLPGLDGLRAIAIIGVLLYHAGLDFFPGGFLGVDVFFVLSGFLITTLILEEFNRSGRIDFKRFYARRAKRLLPALFLMLVIVGLAVAFVYQDAAERFRADSLASLFYVSNWWYIFSEHSYFEFTGRPPVLIHLWSLAIEEQFYLIWPFVVALVIARFSKGIIAIVAIIGALASTLLMVAIALANNMPELADPSRVYFGTDTHLMGLLIGAALATFWRPGRLPKAIAPQARMLLTAIGIAALLLIIAFYVLMSEFSTTLYRGGFLWLSFIVAVAIVAATHPALPLGSWLGAAPLRYLGQRSYGIYLWHWPIFMFTRPMQDLPIDGPLLFSLRIGLTLGIAELSYRFFEMPIRRGALGRWWTSLRNTSGLAKNRIKAAGVAVATAIIVLITVIGLAVVPANSALAPDVAAAIGLDNGGPTEVLIDDENVVQNVDQQGEAINPTAPSDTAPDTSETVTEVNARPEGISAIGDSVMLGARGAIKDTIDGARVDAAVSRMPGAFIGRVKKLSRANKLADTVVIHPATNGVLPESMLRELLDQLTDYPNVIVVNSFMPRTWEKPNNKVIDKVVPDYPNVTIADWKSLGDKNPDFFTSDRIHLTPTGAQAFADLIKNTAQQSSN